MVSLKKKFKTHGFILLVSLPVVQIVFSQSVEQETFPKITLIYLNIIILIFRTVMELKVTKIHYTKSPMLMSPNLNNFKDTKH